MKRYIVLENVEITYPRLGTPKESFGKLVYECTVVFASQEDADRAREMGVNVKTNAQGQQVASLSKSAEYQGVRQDGPKVFDGALAPLAGSKVGHGSRGNVKVYQYDYEYQGKSGVASRLNALQVTELVAPQSSGTSGFTVVGQPESVPAGTDGLKGEF